jgi:hypothetical protein
MAGRNYERLSIEDFGRHLLDSGDLDPVYIALTNVDWDVAQVKRWLVAYWCLYHCGAASYLSTFKGELFWNELRKAAENVVPAPNGGRWSRGSERRHWRGKQALASWQYLQHRYNNQPERMVDYISGPSTVMQEYVTVAERAANHKGFGPWISFKICDMMDRVMHVPVDFNEAAVFMFKDPVKAAMMLYEERNPTPEGMNVRPKQDVIIHRVVEYLTNHFRDTLAPPLGDRPVGLQEVETVLCKWKSHVNGHYPLWNDIREIHEGIEGWGKVAEEFGHAMPDLPQQG